MILKSYEIQKKKDSIAKKNIFLFYGENFGLKKDLKNIVIFENKKKTEDIEIITYSEDEILKSIENFYNLIYSRSLFSKQKIIIVNNITDKLTNHIKKIETDTKSENIIILLSEVLEKKSKIRNFCEKSENIICIACYQDSMRDLIEIAKNEIKKLKIILSNESVNLLIDRANGDRGNLKNEMEKIKMFCVDKEKISFDELKKLTSSAENIYSENLVNSCISGDVREFKKILSEIYQDSLNYIMVLKIFSRKIERLIKIKKIEKNHSNHETLINSVRPPIFWKEKPLIKKQLKIWQYKDLKKLINNLNKIELDCKKNSSISSAIFLNFFINVCKKASSYS